MIDVIIDDHVLLRGVPTVQPAGILGERSAPRDRHGQEQGIEPGVVESLAKITARSDSTRSSGSEIASKVSLVACE